MADRAECEYCARFWKDLEQQAEQSRAWLEKLLADSERDLTALLAKLEADNSLTDLLASLDGCQEMTENDRPGTPIDLQSEYKTSAKKRKKQPTFKQKQRENGDF